MLMTPRHSVQYHIIYQEHRMNKMNHMKRYEYIYGDFKNLSVLTLVNTIIETFAKSQVN